MVHQAMRGVLLGALLVCWACETGQPEPLVQATVQQDAAQAPGLLWETAHDAVLARAKAQHMPVVVEFTAEWCTPCKELEKRTYPDAAVRKQAERFLLVKVDTTDLTKEQEALMARYSVQGLPTVVFIDSNGAVLSERVTGFVEPAALVALMQRVQ